MLRPFLFVILLAFALAEEAVEGEDYLKPSMEILLHLPPEFDSLNSFLSYFQGTRKDTEPRWRRKREASDEETFREEKTEATKFEPPPVQAALRDEVPDQLAIPMDMPRGIMQALYAPFETGRSKDGQPVNDDEDRIQRDKRTFMDTSGGERETTTAMPYWKRKKENPPFVTGRDGGGQKISNYQPAQHRSLDNARESHSIKDLDKTVISNEITRNNQDSFYASTNRRIYNSRQAENYTPRTLKSVYDTIDYTSKRKNQEGRGGFGRNYDNRQSEKVTSEHFARQYTYPRPYDRPYYPLQGDVIGRGVEYYHRTVDPASGRIIYYANMPDPSRYYDPNLTHDPTGRSVYINGRTYLYDPYGRSYIYPSDYRPGVYGRSFDPGYLRNGRSSSEFYYPGADKLQRNSKFNSFADRSKDDFRNRTYIIFDAEESSPDRRVQSFLPSDYNRFGYHISPYLPPYSSAVAPPVPYPNYSFRNQYYPPLQTPIPWATSQKPFPDMTTSNYVTRPLNSPEVQLPLSTRNRSLYPFGDYGKLKKT